MRLFSQNIFLVIIASIIILLPAGSYSKDLLQNNKVININNAYDVKWININVGFYNVNIKTKNDIVEFEFKSKADGFVNKFTKFYWNSKTIAKFDGKKFIPVSVDRSTRLKNKSRNIKIKYDAEGNILSDENSNRESTDKRPLVEQKLKNKTYDTLTLVLEARNRIIDIFAQNNFASGKSSFSLPLYDGRKLSQIDFDVFNNVSSNNLFKVTVKKRPVAGYTNNELKEVKKGDVNIDIFVDVDSFMPIKAVGKSPFGSASSRFVRECAPNQAPDECAL